MRECAIPILANKISQLVRLPKPPLPTPLRFLLRTFSWKYPMLSLIKQPPWFVHQMAITPSFFSWQYRIDATCIPTDHHKVIWFQCPWKTREGSNVTCELILDFLVNLAGQIKEGVYVCVGITTHRSYYPKYHLEKITRNLTVVEKYHPYYDDDQLIYRILEKACGCQLII